MRALWLLALMASPAMAEPVEMGPRPLALVNAMADNDLKTRLLACADDPVRQTDFSIGHRGAALNYPEHSVEGYQAAVAMGAGIVECDVTFTSDHALVCRHAQDDLAETTNILVTDLAARCTRPFSPARGAECRASDLTLAEFRALEAMMEGADKTARTVEGFMAGIPPWRGTAHQPASLITHAESIALLRDLGVKFAPELKAPVVAMPRGAWTREAYAQALIDDYEAAGIPPEHVWVQSFDLDDIRYWLKAEPEFARQAVFLDGRFRHGIDPMRPETFHPSMAELKAMGLNYIAPPLWMLLTLSEGAIVPSPYATAATKAGLKIITWTLERSGPLDNGGGWYFQTITDAVTGDGAVYEVLHVLAQDVGVVGVFSDWPATVSYYASCMGLD
ncbi:MAG: glycerophosphodiester phosphodiesterase family protein [Pseudomonadota bacterium]